MEKKAVNCHGCQLAKCPVRGEGLVRLNVPNCWTQPGRPGFDFLAETSQRQAKRIAAATGLTVDNLVLEEQDFYF